MISRDALLKPVGERVVNWQVINQGSAHTQEKI